MLQNGNQMRKHIELIEIVTVQPEMKSFYLKPRYQDPFVIETKAGEVHTALIEFDQATRLYYFKTKYVNLAAEEVVYIEDRIWDHIKA